MANLNFSSIDSGDIDSGNLKFVGFTGTSSGNEVTVLLEQLLYVFQAHTDPLYSALSHNAEHILGGGDAIDGDKLGIDFTPSNYTPATTPAEVDNLDHLTSHLFGIDDFLGSLSSSITQNASNISTNSGNIASNIADILILSGLITGNAADIQTNAGDISTLESSVSLILGKIDINSGNIEGNTDDIAINAANIASNLAKININSGNIAGNTSAIGGLDGRTTALEATTITGSGLGTGGGALGEGDIVIDIPKATASQAREASSASVAITPSNFADYFLPFELQSGSPIAWDINSGVNAYLYMESNLTLAVPSNLKAGQCGNLEVVQSGSGGYTLSYTGNIYFPNGEAPSLSTGVGQIDLLSWYSPDGSSMYINLLNNLS